MRTVVLFSGGIDSTVLLHDRLSQDDEVIAVSVDYGQTHGRPELDAARKLCVDLDIPHRLITIDSDLLRGSELTGGEGVVVANRNMILIAIAGAVAEQHQAKAVAVACHQGDHDLFPDCRPRFLEEMFRALRAATSGRIRLLYSYAYMTKLDVVRRGVALGVDFARTWSCYRAGPDPCGECLACRERREALFLVGATK